MNDRREAAKAAIRDEAFIDYTNEPTPPTPYPELFAAITDATYGAGGDQRALIDFVWWARARLADLDRIEQLEAQAERLRGERDMLAVMGVDLSQEQVGCSSQEDWITEAKRRLTRLAALKEADHD